MPHCRDAISLSGLPSQLIGLGGWNGMSLRTSETYYIKMNKWQGLPPLKVARQWPGSILLKSKLAYCFCGTEGSKKQNALSSVERIQLDRPGVDWKILPQIIEIAQTFQLAAASYKKKIIVFGGRSISSHTMYSFTEDGNFEKDFSKDSLIPGTMCEGTFLVQDDYIFAVGLRKLDNELKWRIEVFDGIKWDFL